MPMPQVRCVLLTHFPRATQATITDGPVDVDECDSGLWASQFSGQGTPSHKRHQQLDSDEVALGCQVESHIASRVLYRLIALDPRE